MDNTRLYTKIIAILTLELQEALATLSVHSQVAAHLKAAIVALTDLLPPPLAANAPHIESAAELRGATATQDTMLVEKIIDSNLGSDQRAGQ